MTIRELMIRRAIAAIIDYGLFVLFLVAYMKVFGTARADGMVELTGFGHLFTLIFVWALLLPVLEGWLGYTLGKGLLDLKVVTDAGRRIGFSHALKRHLLDPVDLLFSLLAVFIIWRSDHPKRLGDYWAHTKVVTESKPR